MGYGHAGAWIRRRIRLSWIYVEDFGGRDGFLARGDFVIRHIRAGTPIKTDGELGRRGERWAVWITVVPDVETNRQPVVPDRVSRSIRLRGHDRFLRAEHRQ